MLGGCGEDKQSAESKLDQAVGKIHFFNNANAISQKLTSSQINSLNLSKDPNFYFGAILHEPLLQTLQSLDPSANEEQLLSNGNYQFTFFVNNKNVYEENLSIGAGLPSQKKNDTILFKPFFSTANEDSWGRYLWMRFMHYGGEESLKNGENDFRLVMRPYLYSSKPTVGKVIAAGDLKITVEKIIPTKAQIAVQEIKPSKEWEVSDAPYKAELIQQMNKKVIERSFKDITSVVLIKDGQVVIEEYFNGANRNTLHNTRSVTKSVIGTMLGIAIDQQYISDENQTLEQFYPIRDFKNFSESKAKVSLKNLLTMNSDFDGNDQDYESPGNEENMYPSENWVQFLLDLPTQVNRKNRWQYFTGGTVLLGDIVDKKTPNGLEMFAQKHLFTPLKITEYKWQYTPQGVANTAGGLALRSLDLAKFGQLYSNHGQWNNKAVVSKEWVERSLAAQLSRTTPDSTQAYGYLFWNDIMQVGDESFDVSYSSGNGGNKIYIIKELSIVVVITATAYNRPYAHPQAKEILLKHIIPAIL